MNVNWIVRLKNKTFWVAFIPALIMLIEVGVAVFGVEINLGDIGNKLITFVNVLFSVLVLIGVVNDPTTEGLDDSKQALTYVKPKGDEIIE